MNSQILLANQRNFEKHFIAKKRKAKKVTDIQQKVIFYDFCVKNGIDLKDFQPEKIDFEESKLIHTFQFRKEEVKKWNYCFKNLHQDYLQNFPNLQSITFEPKN